MENKITQGFNCTPDGQYVFWALEAVYGAYYTTSINNYVDIGTARAHITTNKDDESVIKKSYKLFSDTNAVFVDYIDADIPTCELAKNRLAYHNAEVARLQALLNPATNARLGVHYKAQIEAKLEELEANKPVDTKYEHFCKWEESVYDRIQSQYSVLTSTYDKYVEKLRVVKTSEDYLEEVQTVYDTTYINNKYARLAKQKAMRSVLWYEPKVFILVTKNCGSKFNRQVIREAVTNGIDVHIECYTHGSLYINGVKGLYNYGRVRKDGRPNTWNSLAINQKLTSDYFPIDKVNDCVKDLAIVTDARELAAYTMSCKVNDALSQYYLTVSSDSRIYKEEYKASILKDEFHEYLRERGYKQDPAKYAERTYTAERLNRAYVWAGPLGIDLEQYITKETMFNSYSFIRTSDVVIEKERTVDVTLVRPKKKGRVSKADKLKYAPKLATLKYLIPVATPKVQLSYTGGNFEPGKETFSRTDLSYNQALSLQCGYKAKQETLKAANLIPFDEKFRHIEYLRLEVLKAVQAGDMETVDVLMDSKWTVCEECGEPYRKTQWGCDNIECDNQKWVTVMCPDVWHCWAYMGLVPKDEMDSKGRIPMSTFNVLHKDLQVQITASARDKVVTTKKGVFTIAKAELAE